MSTGNRLKILGIFACLLVLAAQAAAVGIAHLPSRREPYDVRSGSYMGRQDESFVAFRETVRIPDAPWIRLHFADFELGESSFITITSAEDGGKQVLNAVNMANYRNSSVFFNGEAVDVELHVEQEDRDVFFELKDVTVGEQVKEEYSTMQICALDDRWIYTGPSIGRIVYITGEDTLAVGTAFTTINTAHVTDGAICASGNLDIIQFNVPRSENNGTINHPGPEDQYAVATPVIYANLDLYGNNWGVFPCHPNSVTGLLPYQAQGRGYRVTRDFLPAYLATMGLAGYGRDTYDYTLPGPPNRNHYVLQYGGGEFHAEVYLGGGGVYIKHYVDAQSASEGSPLLYVDYGPEDLAIGVHTYGNCQDPEAQFNYGTSFENSVLRTTVSEFLGTNVVYLDPGHPAPSEDGTVFRPYDGLSESITNVPTGGTIFIVGGVYSGVTTLSKPMTLIAPVGTARIE